MMPPNSLPIQVTNEVQGLQIAIKSPKLATQSYEEMKQLIRTAIAIVGLKSAIVNAITEIEKQMLIGFVQKQFGGNTRQEFIDAFTMAFTGKLNVDPECYQNFSIAYVSRIMTAYRKWASNIYQDNFSTMNKIEDRTETKKLAPGEVDWTETWEDLKAGRCKIIMIPIYDWAEKKGFINLTTEQKLELCRTASNQMRSDLQSQKLLPSQIAQLQDEYKNIRHPAVVNEAKRIAIRNALKSNL